MLVCHVFSIANCVRISIGALPPGPQTPFGFMRLGPDTCEFDDLNVVWRHNGIPLSYLVLTTLGGYFWSDTHVRLFSHTHLVGAGTEDYGKNQR